jgi:hypothetical protein
VKKADLKGRCDKFVKEFTVIQDRGQRVFDAKNVLGKTSDKRWIFELLAVNLVTAWSDFVEDIVYALVNRNSSVLAATLDLDLPRHLTLPTCEAVFTTNGHFDIRDFGDLVGKAKRFIGPKHPFGSVSPADRKLINELTVLRNYVVHRSRVSRNRYISQVLQVEGIQAVITPGRLLLNTQNGATRLDKYLTALERAAKAIKAGMP